MRAKGSTPVSSFYLYARLVARAQVGLYELERQEQRGAPDRGLADAVQRTWPGHLGPFIGCAFSTGHLAMFSGPVAQLVSARRLS